MDDSMYLKNQIFQVSSMSLPWCEGLNVSMSLPWFQTIQNRDDVRGGRGMHTNCPTKVSEETKQKVSSVIFCIQYS